MSHESSDDTGPQARAESRRHRFSDDELLDAAVQLFDDHGYGPVRMSDIADAAGTTKPTLYSRLGSKEEVFAHVVEREARLLQVRLHAAYDAASSRSFRDMVEISVMAFFRFAAERPAGYRLLFGSLAEAPLSGAGDAVLQEVRDHLAELVTGFLRRSGRDDRGYAELIAVAGVGVARHVCDLAVRLDLDLESAGTLAVAYTDAAMRGLKLEALPGMP